MQTPDPDAVWLTSIFEGKVVSTKEDAERGFSFFRERCSCSLLCLVVYCSLNDLSLLRRACEMVGTFACSTLSLECGSKEEAFRLAQLADDHESQLLSAEVLSIQWCDALAHLGAEDAKK